MKRGLDRLWICNTSSRLADVFYFISLPFYGSAQGLGGQDNCEYLFEKTSFGRSLGHLTIKETVTIILRRSVTNLTVRNQSWYVKRTLLSQFTHFFWVKLFWLKSCLCKKVVFFYLCLWNKNVPYFPA